MDLNQLYFEHQVQVMRAAASVCDKARHFHRQSAARIGCAIATLHRASGAAAIHQWDAC